MKRLGSAAFAVTLLAALLSCGSSTPAPAAQAVPGQAPPGQAASPYFTGEGGRGTRLAVMLPDAVGLADDHGYLPDVVQGVLVRDLSRFSAMYVLDRQRLEAIMMELEEAGINQTSEDFFRQREQAADVDYFLTGNITRTATGHTLQFQVTGGREANMGITRAAFTEALTVAQMDDHTGIHRASTELLTGMGVALTYTARTELGRAEARQTINAQVTLAQGINAQRGGTVVEALSRYIQATQQDPALAEATSRLNVLSANVRSGNIREDVRNEIRWRNEWLDTLRQTDEFFVDYTRRPLPLNLVYTTDIRQGSVDPRAGTVDLVGITLALYPDLSWFETANRVLDTVNTGLQATERAYRWGISWPLADNSIHRRFEGLEPPFVPNYNAIWVSVEVLNDEGMVVGRQAVGIPYGWDIYARQGFASRNVMDPASGHRVPAYTYIASFGLRPIAVGPLQVVIPAVYHGHVSPNLSVRISAINGVPTAQAAAQRNISVMTRTEFSSMPNSDYRRWEGYKQNHRSTGGIVHRIFRGFDPIILIRQPHIPHGNVPRSARSPGAENFRFYLGMNTDSSLRFVLNRDYGGVPVIFAASGNAWGRHEVQLQRGGQ